MQTWISHRKQCFWTLLSSNILSYNRRKKGSTWSDVYIYLGFLQKKIQLKQNIEFMFGRENGVQSSGQLKQLAFWGLVIRREEVAEGKKKFCEENSLNPLGNFYAVYIEWDYKTFGGEELLGGWPVNRDFIGYVVMGYVGAHTHLEMRELSEYSGLSVETSEIS